MPRCVPLRRLNTCLLASRVSGRERTSRSGGFLMVGQHVVILHTNDALPGGDLSADRPTPLRLNWLENLYEPDVGRQLRCDSVEMGSASIQDGRFILSEFLPPSTDIRQHRLIPAQIDFVRPKLTDCPLQGF